MISYLEGDIEDLTPTYLILDCNGVGYHLNISLNTFSKIESLSIKKLKIFTHLHIREDAHTLFGFFEKEERKVFRLLISVSGVGASTGMMILSSLNPFEISQAVSLEDINTLKSIKGIGLKSAQRIIIDLKDKVSSSVVDSDILFTKLDNTIKKEALSALASLGFGKKIAENKIDKVLKMDSKINNVEELVKAALSQM